MIVFLICLLISKLNLSYGSSSKSYVSDNVLINGTKIGRAEVISDKLLEKGSCISAQVIKPTDVVIHQTACIDVDAEQMYESLKMQIATHMREQVIQNIEKHRGQ